MEGVNFGVVVGVEGYVYVVVGVGGVVDLEVWFVGVVEVGMVVVVGLGGVDLYYYVDVEWG